MCGDQCESFDVLEQCTYQFFDFFAVSLQVLYKLKTAKVFERHKCRKPDPEDDPFAIQHIHLCMESRLLVVAGLTHCILFHFTKQETACEVSVSYDVILW